MNLKQYIALMVAGTIACWIAFGMVISLIDPTSASWFVFVLFYTTLFFAMVGTFALLGLSFRLMILRHEVVVRQVVIAFRQSFSFAGLVIAALFLQRLDLLYWWNMLLLVGALTLIECAVLLRQRRLPPV